MPMLRRLKPSRRSDSRCSREVTRGSTSTPISAPSEMEKRSRVKPKRSSICAGDKAAELLDLFLQDFQIRRRHFLVFLDDHVAGAEQAQALAKRNVHVQ